MHAFLLAAAFATLPQKPADIDLETLHLTLRVRSHGSLDKKEREKLLLEINARDNPAFTAVGGGLVVAGLHRNVGVGGFGGGFRRYDPRVPHGITSAGYWSPSPYVKPVPEGLRR